MSESQFTVIFEGPSVEGGEIDVRDLAPALLSLGDLFQTANEALNGPSGTTSVKVRATDKACFEVDLSLVQDLPGIISQILDWGTANKDQISSANNLLDLVMKGGGIASAAVLSLFALLKLLKGKKAESIKKEGSTTVVVIEGNTYHVDQRVLVLAEDMRVRQNAKKFVDIMKRDGIDSISVKKDGERVVTVNKGEISSFDIPEQPEEELLNEERDMVLQIISLSFKDDNKWRVTDGLEPFNVSIEDEDFLKRIANDEIAFSKGDYLLCTVREKQVSTLSGLKKDRAIVKVQQHKPAPRQLRLV